MSRRISEDYSDMHDTFSSCEEEVKSTLNLSNGSLYHGIRVLFPFSSTQFHIDVCSWALFLIFIAGALTMILDTQILANLSATHYEKLHDREALLLSTLYFTGQLQVMSMYYTFTEDPAWWTLLLDTCSTLKNKTSQLYTVFDAAALPTRQALESLVDLVTNISAHRNMYSSDRPIQNGIIIDNISQLLQKTAISLSNMMNAAQGFPDLIDFNVAVDTVLTEKVLPYNITVNLSFLDQTLQEAEAYFYLDSFDVESTLVRSLISREMSLNIVKEILSFVTLLQPDGSSQNVRNAFKGVTLGNADALAQAVALGEINVETLLNLATELQAAVAAYTSAFAGVSVSPWIEMNVREPVEKLYNQYVNIFIAQYNAVISLAELSTLSGVRTSVESIRMEISNNETKIRQRALRCVIICCLLELVVIVYLLAGIRVLSSSILICPAHLLLALTLGAIAFMGMTIAIFVQAMKMTGDPTESRLVHVEDLYVELSNYTHLWYDQCTQLVYTAIGSGNRIMKMAYEKIEIAYPPDSTMKMDQIDVLHEIQKNFEWSGYNLTESDWINFVNNTLHLVNQTSILEGWSTGFWDLIQKAQGHGETQGLIEKAITEMHDVLYHLIYRTNNEYVSLVMEQCSTAIANLTSTESALYGSDTVLALHRVCRLTIESAFGLIAQTCDSYPNRIKWDDYLKQLVAILQARLNSLKFTLIDERKCSPCEDVYRSIRTWEENVLSVFLQVNALTNNRDTIYYYLLSEKNSIRVAFNLQTELYDSLPNVTKSQALKERDQWASSRRIMVWTAIFTLWCAQIASKIFTWWAIPSPFMFYEH